MSQIIKFKDQEKEVYIIVNKDGLILSRLNDGEFNHSFGRVMVIPLIFKKMGETIQLFEITKYGHKIYPMSENRSKYIPKNLFYYKNEQKDYVFFLSVDYDWKYENKIRKDINNNIEFLELKLNLHFKDKYLSSKGYKLEKYKLKKLKKYFIYK